MSEISLETAISVAEHYLNEVMRNPYDAPKNDRWVISLDKIYEREGYWIFHYQSELYLKTGNLSYLLAGNLPLKISRANGEILGFEKID